MLGHWIVDDTLIRSAVIATFCRAIGVLNPDDDFASVEPSPPDGAIPSTLGSLPAGQQLGMQQHRPIGGIGSDLREFSQNLLMSAATQAGLGERFVNVTGGIVQSVVELGGGSRRQVKGRLEPPPTPAKPRVPSGLVQLSASQGMGGSTNAASSASGVSSSTQDGGVGMPSFAIQQALLMIKITAEICLLQLLTLTAAIPPFGEITGVTRLSTLWDEKLAIQALLKQKGVPGEAPSAESFRKYVKIYAIENRVLVSVVDEPLGEVGPLKGSTATVIVRDASAKNSWSTFLNYGQIGSRYATADEPDHVDESDAAEDVRSSNDSLYGIPDDRNVPENIFAAARSTSGELPALSVGAIPSLDDLISSGPTTSAQFETIHTLITREDRQIAQSVEGFAVRNSSNPAAIPTTKNAVEEEALWVLFPSL